MNVGDWLRTLGLQHYESTFVDNAIGTDVLPELTEADLEKLGVVLGDRRRLLKAIKASTDSVPAAPGTGSEESPAYSSVYPEERRHLSVMICDLVDSTAISARLDPEDMRTVMDAYHATCARVTLFYDGFLADFRGDGILALFGYPRAHEDDAERTVRAGLDIAAAVGRLKTPAVSPLSVRIGIATGLLLVRTPGGEGTLREHLPVGDAPNIAARVQALGDPGAVVIAASTRRLLGDRFRLRDLGQQKLKGIAEPVSAFVVEGVAAVGSRFAAGHPAGQAGLIGRESEMELLLKCKAAAWQGEGQIVLISGEAGIGKSRLVAAFQERIETEKHEHTVLHYQSSPLHSNSALHPVIAQLDRAAGLKADDTPEQRLDKLEALLASSAAPSQDAAPLLAALLSIPFGDRYPRLALNPTQQRRRTLAALLDQFENLAREKPILLIFEDAHWADATTLEMLHLAVERIRHLPVLALFTFRPELELPWVDLPNISTMTLGRLDHHQVENMVAQMTQECTLPPEVMKEIVAKTDGNPLFVEELTKTVLEAGILVKEANRYRLPGPLPALAIPATLRDSLMARLDRLQPVKDVAQTAAAIGREFSYALVRELVPRDETSLKYALIKLEQAGLLFRRGEPPDAVFRFKHALVRDAAYENLPKNRRQQLHGQIARSIERNFPEILLGQPEIVAHHFTEACLPEAAIGYWLKAGNLALTRSANTAVRHLNEGLKQVPRIADAAVSNRWELLLQTSLGNALQAAKGWSIESVKPAYTRALELCKETGLDEHTLPAVFGLWTWNFVHSSLNEAQSLAEELLRTAENVGDTVYRVLAHEALGFTLFGKGQFAASHAELQRSISMCEDSATAKYLDLSAQDPRVHARLYDGMVLWFLGYPDQALRICAEARRYADASQHPFSEAMALTISLRVHQLRGEAADVAAQVNAAISLCEEHEFLHYLATALILRGWASAQQGDFEKGIADMELGLEKQRTTGALLYESYTLALLADACIRNEHYREALDFLDQAQSRLDKEHCERFYSAEIYRLLAEANLWLHNDPGRAEHFLHKGIQVAREQNARSFELKLCLAMDDLYDIKQSGEQCRSRLGEVYRSFTEGFETADLVRARAKLAIPATSAAD